MKFKCMAILLSLLALPSFAAEEDGQQRFIKFAKNLQVSTLESLPVLANGRIKPLHTLARESVLYLNGKYRLWGLDPVKAYLGLAVYPDSDLLRLIEVRDTSVRQKLKLETGRRYFSASELNEAGLVLLAEPLLARGANAFTSLSQEEKNVVEAYHQMASLESIMGGGHLLSVINFNPTQNGEGLASAVREFLGSLINGAEANLKFKQAVISQAHPEDLKWQFENLELEVFYNQAQPFFWAAIGLLLLGLLSFVLNNEGRWLSALSLVLLVLQVAGLLLRVRITGFAPVTNMYGTMIWVSLGMNLFALLLYWFYRNAWLNGFLWLVAGLVLLATESVPLILSPDLDPVVAVLRSNFWLTTHVLTITISYAAFALAMIIGNVALVRALFQENDQTFITSASHICYRLIQVGVFLITAGIILGGVWADYSWGRFWGWDPKETWALIVDLGFLAILHGRHAGYISRTGLLMTAPAAFLLVIMAWYGVNFILAAGLHSYGFSSGGTMMIGSFVAAQILIYLLYWGSRAWRRPQTAVGPG